MHLIMDIIIKIWESRKKISKQVGFFPEISTPENSYKPVNRMQGKNGIPWLTMIKHDSISNNDKNIVHVTNRRWTK